MNAGRLRDEPWSRRSGISVAIGAKPPRSATRMPTEARFWSLGPITNHHPDDTSNPIHVPATALCENQTSLGCHLGIEEMAAVTIDDPERFYIAFLQRSGMVEFQQYLKTVLTYGQLRQPARSPCLSEKKHIDRFFRTNIRGPRGHRMSNKRSKNSVTVAQIRGE
jgi:hypothetical protein